MPEPFGSLFVGARHVQFVPGTYRIVKISTYAQRLFEHLGIIAGPGQSLPAAQVEAILDFYIELLEAVEIPLGPDAWICPKCGKWQPSAAYVRHVCPPPASAATDDAQEAAAAGASPAGGPEQAPRKAHAQGPHAVCNRLARG